MPSAAEPSPKGDDRYGMDSPRDQAGEVADGVPPHHGDPAAGTCVIYVPTEGWAKMPSATQDRLAVAASGKHGRVL